MKMIKDLYFWIRGGHPLMRMKMSPAGPKDAWTGICNQRLQHLLHICIETGHLDAFPLFDHITAKYCLTGCWQSSRFVPHQLAPLAGIGRRLHWLHLISSTLKPPQGFLSMDVGVTLTCISNYFFFQTDFWTERFPILDKFWPLA